MNEAKKNLLKQAGLGSFVERVEKGLCPTCGKAVDNNCLINEISKKEFEISGMCQECQDSVYS
jgi:hypothetical protein